MKKEKKYIQGQFYPNYPEKYKGDVNNIVYRSSWERKVFKWLDENTNVLEWSSEEIIIPYISPIDKKLHRYFPDVYVKAITQDNTIKEMLLEVKPYKQTIEPKPAKRKTKQYITEVMTWGINQSKWKCANEYCLDRGWEFKVITENDLFPGMKKGR